MQVILLERVPKLGQMGETVKVRDGFARNYLLPLGKALRANAANKTRFEAERATLEARNLERKSEAQKVADVLAGKWKSEDTKWGMKEGMIELVALNPAVPPDVAKLYETKKKALLDGTLHTFGGPVKDQAGNLKVAAGQVLPEKELWSLNWYVDGVEGSIPKG